jgi:FkbM family methyltransferase
MNDICTLELGTSLRMLSSRCKHTVLLRLAKALGMSKIRIKGDYGEISGFVDDTHIFGVYLRDGAWSEHINSVFADYFAGQRSGTFLDIGANIGLTTIPVARNPRVFCHAFEPDPDNFELLQENISSNVGTNVQLHNLALFSDAAPLTLALSAENRGNHMVWRTMPRHSSPHFSGPHRKTITVRGACLDQMWEPATIEMPLAIKIDAEGSEYHIYKGGRNIICLAELVVMEYWPYGIEKVGGNTDELISMMVEDFDYAAILDDGAGSRICNLMDISRIACKLRRMSEQIPVTESAEMAVDIVLRKRRNEAHWTNNCG